MSCTILKEDTIDSIKDQVTGCCGYSYLVLDDCDLGDERVVDVVRKIANGVNAGGGGMKSSGLIIVVTTTDGAKSLNRLVGDHLRSGGKDLQEIKTETIHSMLTMHNQEEKMVKFQESLGSPKLLSGPVPFLPLTLDTVAKCAQRAAKDQGSKLSGAALKKIIEMQQFSPIRNVKIANSGCKQIANKIDIITASSRSSSSEL